jgi:predicted nucleotidyltransferase
MKFGLNDDILEIISRYVQVFPDVDELIIFGSRAIGNYKPASDIDIALKGILNTNTASDFRNMLDNAPRFPYKVDVLDYNSISNIELKKHIDEEGKLFYKNLNNK